MAKYPTLEAKISQVMEAAMVLTVPPTHKRKQSQADIQGRLFTNPLELSQIIQAGLPYPLFEVIFQKALLTEKEWSHILDISEKTLSRYSKEGPEFRFRRYQSEKILDVAQVTDLGLSFFDTTEAYRQWLDTPNYQFRGQKPIDMLSDSHGCSLLCDELGRIEYGLFS